MATSNRDTDPLTEFTKTKMHFALALLGTLFALHPFIEKLDNDNAGFWYLSVYLKVFYTYALIAGLLALAVYCYALALLSERPYSTLEKVGNNLYAIAIMVLPLYGGLYLSSVIADQLGERNLAAAPWAAALAMGVGWLFLSQVLAFRLRKRLGDQDRTAKASQLAEQEIESLNRAQEMFSSQHYDLSVIACWKAIEARLRRVLLARRFDFPVGDPHAMIDQATRAGLLSKPALAQLQDLRQQWNIAVGVDPVTREAAESAMKACRNILSTIPLEDRGKLSKHTV